MRHMILAAIITTGISFQSIASVPTDAEASGVKVENALESGDVNAGESKAGEAKVNDVKSQSSKSEDAKVKSSKLKKSKSKTAKASKSTKVNKVAKSEKKSSKKKAMKVAKKSKKDSKWNEACDDLLDSSVKSTIALEKSLLKKKRNLTQEQFDEKVHEELLVVQLNAWVCAVSSSQNKVGASVEEQFLQDYSKRVQNRKM